MKSIRYAIAGVFTLAALAAAQQPATHQWTIVVHGGAGAIERSALGPKGDAAYRAGLTTAIEAGAKVLDRGGSALDAVEAVLNILEDDPLFNAGRGAVFTSEGKNELDASIMDGSNLKAGAVAGVTHTRHPISLARAVMEKSPYVMMIGSGAEAFGARNGLEQVDPSFFFTEARWQSLVKQLTKEGRPIPPRPAGAPPPAATVPVAFYDEPGDSRSHGTTGVVALDRQGKIAAGTSTGGVQAKMPGRVGDSPIIGAGTYASNQSCAVSATGTGEFFIRLGIAREICNLVAFKGTPIQQAADQVIHHELEALHGDGGVIALTPDGQSAFSFNTPGMFRARLSEGGKIEVHIYKDEE
ncbi:MAG TPA: isoaspartyl peptidase/L-asparaginase [Bryobacteraceae bacterium]|nr:isoaspartyl peptidase/L-asparaginase [Bryobacteraceae bacterium]